MGVGVSNQSFNRITIIVLASILLRISVIVDLSVLCFVCFLFVGKWIMVLNRNPRVYGT